MLEMGFDNEKYLREQTQAILQRMEKCDGKLYLECGGKLLFDYHASRVLPGFDSNVKMRVFQSLKDQIDIIVCIYAEDIERRKIRSDFGITYDTDVFKMIDDFAEWGLSVTRVVITRFNGQPSAVQFMNRLARRGIKVYTHKITDGYPSDIDAIVSDEGYGANPYIETTKPVVLVTAPGPGSGKLATCLSQLYHDYRRNIKSGYAKFETFPIWNLPINHPVNIAYESATADIGDVNQIDHFHLSAYGVQAVSYSRDMEAFPVLKRIVERITNRPSFYQSPTDMGVNRCGFGIVDDKIVREAACQEVIRRYFRAACDYARGIGTADTIGRIKLMMESLQLTTTMRTVVPAAEEALKKAVAKGKGRDGIVCAAAIELPDGTLVTGSNSEILHAASALVLNAAKKLAGIPKAIDLIPKQTIESIRLLKRDVLSGRRVSLDLDETLICLAMSAPINPSAQYALEKLPLLRECEVHLTHLPSVGDSNGLRKLGLHTTSEPKFPSANLHDE
ncbi:MAG: DUF1846 domain-containing protein [Sphaerochaetaceae bacterium]|jgi:uncharacterized protein (UPF0371 family)|nr:DUF1846 domain-containing protein [Sphaerochaetaceae bacterium]MDD4219380.1 DUF1846 domain-containing protein [Sphaerochaetaceae bacterium]MDY0371386.1 DUF1846 domain-containing protein [Sphaerochaetaceae bacterium]